MLLDVRAVVSFCGAELFVRLVRLRIQLSKFVDCARSIEPRTRRPGQEDIGPQEVGRRDQYVDEDDLSVPSSARILVAIPLHNVVCSGEFHFGKAIACA